MPRAIKLRRARNTMRYTRKLDLFLVSINRSKLLKIEVKDTFYGQNYPFIDKLNNLGNSNTITCVIEG